MVIIIYFAVIFFLITQSASTKAYNRRDSDSLYFNATKAIASLALFAMMAVGGFTFHLPTVFFGLLYGSLMCLSMYAGYRALCLGPMALTSMLVSFSILIPLCWGLIVCNETLNLLRSIALLLLVGAIVLTNIDKLLTIRCQKKDSVDPAKRSSYGLWLFFVGTTFLCNGFCSVLQKQHQELYPEDLSEEFMFFAMLLCTLIYLVLFAFRFSTFDCKRIRGKWLGAVSGISNGLASYFTLTLAGLENASILFPIISAGNLLGVMVCGRFLFHEKLKLNHYLGLLLGILAVVFLKI